MGTEKLDLCCVDPILSQQLSMEMSIHYMKIISILKNYTKD